MIERLFRSPYGAQGVSHVVMGFGIAHAPGNSPFIAFDRQSELSAFEMHYSKIVVRLGQFWIDAYRLGQGGESLRQLAALAFNFAEIGEILRIPRFEIGCPLQRLDSFLLLAEPIQDNAKEIMRCGQARSRRRNLRAQFERGFELAGIIQLERLVHRLLDRDGSLLHCWFLWCCPVARRHFFDLNRSPNFDHFPLPHRSEPARWFKEVQPKCRRKNDVLTRLSSQYTPSLSDVG